MVNMLPFNPRDGRAILAARPFLSTFATPGTGVNFLEQLSGDSPGNPSTTLVSAAGGAMYYFNGTAWVAANVDAAETITTGRAVFGTPFFKRLFIANDDTMLVYDYELNLLSTPTPTAGLFPEDLRVLATHMGTLWGTGSEIEGHVLYGSRTGDAFNWDFSFTDEGRPFQTTGENSGLINQPGTALISLASDMMVVAGESSMMMMLGHPSRNGTFFPLSSTIGVLGQGAWCKGDDNTAYAMSYKGLIQISPTGDGVAALVSESKLPNSLKGIPFDRMNPTISMAFDTRWNGIHIIVNDPDQPQAWWYSIKTGGFYRMSFGDTLPTRLKQYDPIVSLDASGVLYAGAGNGGMARMTVTGTEVARPNAWAFLGPIALTGETASRKAGIVTTATVTLSNDTDPSLGTFALYTGISGEDAFIRAYNNLLGSGYAVKNSTLDNNNGVCFPRLSGSDAVMIVGDGGSGEYGLESVDLEIEKHGFNLRQQASGYTYDIEFGLDDYSPDYNFAAEPGYATFIPLAAMDETVTDCPNFIDLSQAPSRWWRGLSATDGREIMATDATNHRVPMHVLWIDRPNRQGMVAAKKTQDGTVPVRLWTMTGQSAIPAAGSTYGQHNAYATWIQNLWALGDGVDVTANALTLTMPGALTYDNSPHGFRGATCAVFGGETVAPEVIPAFNVAANFALFFMSNMADDNEMFVKVRTAIDADLTSESALKRFDDSDPKELHADIANGETSDVISAVDDVAYDGSAFPGEWMGVGAVFKPGVHVRLQSPVTDVTATGIAEMPAGTYHMAWVGGPVDTLAMMQRLAVSDEAVTIAYFDMLHACLAGTFWDTPTFTLADPSAII